MALPKRRHSKTRGRKRRTFWKVTSPDLGVCPHCKTPKVPHTVCLVCGYYRGRQVIEIKEKKQKKKPGK
jgi:large subunit ribosomal protein L32